MFRQSHHRVAEAWEEFHRGWEAMRRQPRVGAEVFVIDVAKLLILALRSTSAFRILDVRAPFWLFLVLAPVAALAGVLAVTPGALGLREATVAAAAAGMGYGLPTGLLAATVDRGAMILVTVILGSTSYWWTRPAPRRGSHPRARGASRSQPGGRDDVGDDALESSRQRRFAVVSTKRSRPAAARRPNRSGSPSSSRIRPRARRDHHREPSPPPRRTPNGWPPYRR